MSRNRTAWPVYKWVFPIHLRHPTLALIALTPIGGALAGIMELQSRWVSAVISGNCKLPPKEQMRRFQVVKQNMYKKRSRGRFQVEHYNLHRVQRVTEHILPLDKKCFKLKILPNLLLHVILISFIEELLFIDFVKRKLFRRKKISFHQNLYLFRTKETGKWAVLSIKLYIK